jgi:gamma-glutamylcyclotransferase (GGCT)/AIG2-like uncharacterized protein YtfP
METQLSRADGAMEARRIGGERALLFAYGSLLSPALLRRHIPSAELVTKAELANYEVQFRQYSEARQGGTSCIIEAPGRLVRGVVYSIAREEMHDLDVLEGVPEGRYRREVFLVLGQDGEWYEAYLYRLANPSGPFTPAKSYLDDMIEGAQAHGLDAEYTQRLISWRRSLD